MKTFECFLPIWKKIIFNGAGVQLSPHYRVNSVWGYMIVLKYEEIQTLMGDTGACYLYLLIKITIQFPITCLTIFCQIDIAAVNDIQICFLV